MRKASRRLLPGLLAAVALGLAMSPQSRAAAAAQQEFEDAMARTPDVVRGETLYRICAGCHRDTGMGNRDGTVPVIAGQHRGVLIRQLADYRHARRWDPRMQHYAYLLRLMNDAIEGSRPSFPADHLRLLEGLSQDDRIGLADALSRLR